MNQGVGRVIGCLMVLICFAGAKTALAEDWNAYAIVPVSAQAMTLEAVESGTSDGTIVSIGKTSGTPNQKWIITPKGNDFYSIHPSYSMMLVLAIEKGGTKNGTQAVLETDKNEPWQQWSIRKTADGNYNLIPRHVQDKGLDDNGGKKEVGARQDLWEFHPNDQHLQWIIRPLAGSGITAPSVAAPTYVAPEIKPESILKGQIKQIQFNDSKIFPGTVRDVTVFIPAQYDGSKPACVYVKTDGYNPGEKPLLEEMIATKEIPMTIGVFVKPGNLPAPVKGTIGRRNRDFEYDGVSDNNVRFLNDELLPFVAKQFDLKLSTNGNDRCISGGSSGGIAAFAAAWNRPDAFSRVYAASGSFVAFRGGHEFPTLIRKTEAKPIRAFLTTGTHDMENCAGDWFLLDQEMDKALQFSGYDYLFRIINGGHVAGYMDNYREAMAYLWKDWPEPVKAGPSAPRVQDVIVPGEGWQLAAEGLHDPRGPASNARGEVFFVESANQIDRLDLDGHVQPFAASDRSIDSLAVGAKGEIYSVSTASGEIQRYDSTGKASVIAEGIHGHCILAMPDGGLYVTAMTDKSPITGAIYFLKDGKQNVVDSGLGLPTGLAYRPDQWLLSVAEGTSKWVDSYQINPDGTLINKERFFSLHVPDWQDIAAPESVCYAKEGQMLVATNMGIQICADDGPTQVILPLPGNARPLGLCLGGPDRDTLFAFTGDKICKRKVKIHSVGAFDLFVKVNGTKL
jgi:enterochelin esterase-like enzyme/sugar lactone lactonase YvrE